MTRVITAGRIDCALVEQLSADRNYWREVLRRVVETVKFLVELGLPSAPMNQDLGVVVPLMES